LAGVLTELLGCDDCGGGELAVGDELAEVVVAVVIVKAGIVLSHCFLGCSTKVLCEQIDMGAQKAWTIIGS
jgi:hypothetical protein